MNNTSSGKESHHGLNGDMGISSSSSGGGSISTTSSSTTTSSSSSHHRLYRQQTPLSAEAVAALPPPGLAGPSSMTFSPHSDYLAFRRQDRQLCVCSTSNFNQIQPLLRPPTLHGEESLEEKLRRERQRINVTQFSWVHAPPSSLTNHLHHNHVRHDHDDPNVSHGDDDDDDLSSTTSTSSGAAQGQQQSSSQRPSDAGELRLLLPIRGSLYLQRGIQGPMIQIYDKASHKLSIPPSSFGSVIGRDSGAIDAQLSPDGQFVAFVVAGDLYVVPAVPKIHRTTSSRSDSRRTSRSNKTSSLRTSPPPPTRITFGARQDGEVCISHGLADFVAQEEMDRYRGFWWSPDSKGILFAKVDESHVPPYRITHQGSASAPTMSSSSSSSHFLSSSSPNTTPSSSPETYEDHRYPFAGHLNPTVQLGFIPIHASSILAEDPMPHQQALAQHAWNNQVVWFQPPREAQEYLARVSWLPDGSACAQWQNRIQSTLVLAKYNMTTGKCRTLLVERSDVWINLHHMFHVLPRPIHPQECANNDTVLHRDEERQAEQAERDTFTSIRTTESRPFQYIADPCPPGSFSFVFASERTGFSHVYLYTYVPGINNERAMLIRALSGGDWMVESIVGIDLDSNAIYVSGTFDSPLEKHLYALPILPTTKLHVDSNHNKNHYTNNNNHNAHNSNSNNHNSSHRDPAVSNGDYSHHQSGRNNVRRSLKNVMNAFGGNHYNKNKNNSTTINCKNEEHLTPIRLTTEQGMHDVIMDPSCRMFVDTSSDLGRPTSVKIYTLARGKRQGLDICLLCSLYDASIEDKTLQDISSSLIPPPELLSFPTSDGTETLHAALYRPDPRIHGMGPHPLICAVYGGPYVQRVNRSWTQCCDMRAQWLRSLGFCVVKCDNRGSSRRGVAFEGAIHKQLGRLEVLDQVAAVRHLTVRGIADASRVGIYGWSYGGYLSAMCLSRAPNVFHVAVAGAPVTSWDGYDTHYTERYMGLPAENPIGYRESSVLEHVPNMRGKLMMVHGLIDENVHFRHTARLINRLIAAGKDYDLLIFPDERHSPRRLRDRIYMEQRISDYFLQHLGRPRQMAGHL